MRSELTTKDNALEKEKKLVEGLNNHLQELVHSAQTEQEQKNNKEQELSETKAQLEAAKSTVENLIREKEEVCATVYLYTKHFQLLVKHHELTAEYEKFKEEQRPSIRTELERRYEETRYRLNNALEKIQKLEVRNPNFSMQKLFLDGPGKRQKERRRLQTQRGPTRGFDPVKGLQRAIREPIQSSN